MRTVRRLLHNLIVRFRKPPYTKGFRTPAELADHFNKHGSSVSCLTEDAYEMAADTFCGGYWNKSMVTCVRPKERRGATILYDTSTNEFAILGKDGFVESYFLRRQRGGMRFFEKQCS